MGISGIPNPEAMAGSAFRPGWWVGWQIGWWTGWWNPFDHLKEIDPEEVSRLTVVQGEFLVQQADMFTKQAQAVVELGRSISRKQG